MERVTIIVDARDRFSTTTKCLETLFANTPQAIDVIVVIGGAPEHLKREWQTAFGNRARFIFKDQFINQPQARNIGLREAKTRLAVQIDNDNFVRPGWLEALVRCQQETNAVLVVPVILERPDRIHTAGNDLYITKDQGKTHAYKHLRYFGMPYGEGANMKRQRTDYSELHCQLVVVEPTLRLGANDEAIIEVGEVDQGLTFAKAGYEMWFEPASVVHYALRCPVEADDIRFFAWRWDLRRVDEGYRYFERKWGMDVSEHGTFRDWLVRYNAQIGLLPRLWPTAAAIKLDQKLGELRERVTDLMLFPKYRFQRLRKRQLGYYDWTAGVSKS
ncbi:MAG: hypothetical protein COV75_04020 [Candidatus Omnitrophica bacterium CG11_big_fil_rev_8_21_14_0_20_63_9]|nr:MAG: hypothetical protein COV75_04020 [Candidatus Omnitrophica bacterium CG11_big_fil_rev_8_21_14_0_20_63_9]